MAKSSVFTNTTKSTFDASTGHINGATSFKPRKAKPVAAAAAETVDPSTKFSETIHAATEDYAASLGLPSGKRVLISTIVGFLVAASSMYWAVPVIELAMLGALLFSGSLFLSFLVYLIGMLLAIWSSVVVGNQAFNFCVSFDYEATKSAVTDKVSTAKSWFNTRVLRRVEA